MSKIWIEIYIYIYQQSNLTPVINLKFNRSKNIWKLNKSTDTNGIATEGEAKSKLLYVGTVDTNKCCTKSKALSMGANSGMLFSYDDNQLVKYSDIQKQLVIKDGVSVKNGNTRSAVVACNLQGTLTLDQAFNNFSSPQIMQLDPGSTKLIVSEGDPIGNGSSSSRSLQKGDRVYIYAKQLSGTGNVFIIPAGSGLFNGRITISI